MLGRQRELCRALDLLASGQRILNIVGVPGVGKSLFAQRVARAHQPGGSVVEIDLREVADATWLRRSIALGAGFSTTARLETLLADLDVLVLDGYASGTSDFIGDVLELAARFASLTVLVIGDVLQHDGPAATLQLGPLAPESSAQLLRSRAPSLAHASDAHVEAVARPCCGHPVALILAAQQAARVPAKHLARLLEAHASELRSPGAEGGGPLSVRLLFEQHFDELSATEGTTLAALAHFQGPFTRAMALRCLLRGVPKLVTPLRGLRVATIGDWEGRGSTLQRLIDAGATAVEVTDHHDLLVAGPEAQVTLSDRVHQVSAASTHMERTDALQDAVCDLLGQLSHPVLDRLVGAGFLTRRVQRPLPWLQVFPLFGPLARERLPDAHTQQVRMAMAQSVAAAVHGFEFERHIDDEATFAQLVEDILRGVHTAAESLINTERGGEAAALLSVAAEMGRRYGCAAVLRPAVKRCVDATVQRSLPGTQCTVLDCALSDLPPLDHPQLRHLHHWRSVPPQGVEATVAADALLTAAELTPDSADSLQLCREAVTLVIEGVEGPRCADYFLRAGQIALRCDALMEARAFLRRASRHALRDRRRVLVTYIQRAVR
jgi:hypothetical protein